LWPELSWALLSVMWLYVTGFSHKVYNLKQCAQMKKTAQTVVWDEASKISRSKIGRGPACPAAEFGLCPIVCHIHPSSPEGYMLCTWQQTYRDRSFQKTLVSTDPSISFSLWKKQLPRLPRLPQTVTYPRNKCFRGQRAMDYSWALRFPLLGLSCQLLTVTEAVILMRNSWFPKCVVVFLQLDCDWYEQKLKMEWEIT
jgi:hypothetical protein